MERPVGVTRTYDAIELDDWPHESIDENFALVLQGLADGGGPLFVSDRYDGYPELQVVHAQLIARFGELRRSVEQHISFVQFSQAPDCDVVAISREYGNAQRVLAVTWKDGDSRCDLVGCLTGDGGSVDALLDRDAFWHSPSAS
jgi:hypothetical protein